MSVPPRDLRPHPPGGSPPLAHSLLVGAPESNKRTRLLVDGTRARTPPLSAKTARVVVMASSASSSDPSALVELFKSISIDEKLAKSSVQNAKFAANLATVIAAAGCAETGLDDRKRGNLLYTVAGKHPSNALAHRDRVIGDVMRGDLKTSQQLDGVFEYLKVVGEEPLDDARYREAGGVGVVVTEADVEAAFDRVVSEGGQRQKLLEERYRAVATLLKGFRDFGVMKWADGKTLKATFDRKVEELLGPKTEADLAKPAKKKKKPKAKPAEDKAARGEREEEERRRAADPYAFFSKPEENNVVHTTVNFSDGRVMRISNTKRELDAYLGRTGGKYLTRFPPEPNGYLHLGHAKAMFIDFGLAAKHDGSCYLRYDDTNPTAEKTEYISHIQEIVEWMGWKPFRVTYSSDYFERLYELAVRLIESGHAYVCHQTGDEISEYREQKRNSPWRDRPAEESLRLFQRMRLGLVDEGTATLRMRMDMQNENFNMYDLIAYRIKFARHPHAGDEWCIYPSYDFTHCIVDSLEDISHSLCTLEFEPRRASYYWLLEVLGLYKPVVWEYSRLNMEHNVMSKRKLNRLVTEGHVNGWDDPRLLTLAGLRRRGYTATAINSFCRDSGITKNDQQFPYHKLEHHARSNLDEIAPRRLGVLRPLKVAIENVAPDFLEVVKAKVFPGRSDETYELGIGKFVYIEKSDFRQEDQKGYYGLALGKTVMLRYAFAVKCVGFETCKETGEVVLVRCERVEVKKPPKGVIHWVGSESLPEQYRPVKAEARLYDYLFNAEDVAEVGDDWLADMNQNSLEIVEGALLGPTFRDAQPGQVFQLERAGYFCVDKDTDGNRLVLNRTVELKERNDKKKI